MNRSLLSVLLAASLFTGCGSGGGDNTPGDDLGMPTMDSGANDGPDYLEQLDTRAQFDSLADDGVPGRGGPGGYDGGRGGRDDTAQTPEIIRGGAGLGPGGGKGGIEGVDGCSNNRYYKYAGLGGAHATNGSDSFFTAFRCGTSADQAKAYGSAQLQPLLGGSGGGGGRGGTNYAGSGGGGGGGALLIASSGTIQLAPTGSIDATGGTSGLSGGAGAGSQGGGGSGGSVRLVAIAALGAAGAGGASIGHGEPAAHRVL
mgnify:CR=1 FL=1